MTLAEDVLAGNRRALARLLTHIENGAGVHDDLAALYSATGRAHLVGITGAPGTGKSSLVNQLALAYRSSGRTVAILAVDPTSPFTGGAILGDRIRMRDLAGDPGVFIRSMASRGNLGGLARASDDMIKALDAAGFDVVLVETVGAGQAEVDIARHTETVLVIEAPGLGDDIQAIKAGILEIADILVVNKGDDPRSKSTERGLKMMLELNHSQSGSEQALTAHHGQLMAYALPSPSEPASPAEDGGWEIPVMKTVATTGEGVAELVEQIDAHRRHLTASGEIIRRQKMRVTTELDYLLREALLQRLLQQVDGDQLNHLIDEVTYRRLMPQAAVDILITES